MSSKLVDDVRAMVGARVEEVPLSSVERALLITIVATPARTGEDVVDELEAAIRRVQTDVPATALDPIHRAAIGRLLVAARAVLAHEAPTPPPPPPPTPVEQPRRRLDIDG